MGAIKDYFERRKAHKQYISELDNIAELHSVENYISRNYREPTPPKPAAKPFIRPAKQTEKPQPKPEPKPEIKPVEPSSHQGDGYGKLSRCDNTNPDAKITILPERPESQGRMSRADTNAWNREPSELEMAEFFASMRQDAEKFNRVITDIARSRPCFADKVTEHMNAKGLKASEVYNRCAISRQTWSNIMMQDAKISKDSAIQVALGLHLSFEQAEELISLAGYSLVLSDKCDVAMSFYFKNHVYNIILINNQLADMGLKILGKK